MRSQVYFFEVWKKTGKNTRDRSYKNPILLSHVQFHQRFYLLAAVSTFSFYSAYRSGSEEFLQRHNSKQNFLPANAYRRLWYKKVWPASGIPRIPPQQRWSSIWNPADERKNEQ